MCMTMSRKRVRDYFSAYDVFGNLLISDFLGRFIPTRRTPGVSTSELLERIVSGYRKGEWDAKLEKIGHPELKAEGSDWGGSVGGRSPRTPSSPV